MDVRFMWITTTRQKSSKKYLLCVNVCILWLVYNNNALTAVATIRHQRQGLHNCILFERQCRLLYIIIFNCMIFYEKLPFYKIQVCMIVFFRTLIVLTFTCEHLLVAHVQISIRSIETWHFYQNTVFTSAWSSRLCVFTCMCTVVCDVFLSLCMSFVSASSFPQSPLCPLIDNLTSLDTHSLCLPHRHKYYRSAYLPSVL